MYKDYKSIYGETLVSDEKGMHQIETTDKIGEELTLENEIEILETKLSSLTKEKEKLGTVEENQKLIKKCYMIAIAMIIGVSALVKFFSPIISPTIELSFY